MSENNIHEHAQALLKAAQATHAGRTAHLLIGRGGGLAWLVAGIVGAFVGAIVNAWVLLVEILR